MHAALIVLLIALATANYATLQAILNIDLDKASIAVLVWTFGKQTIVTLAVIGALFFYVRWMNRWFERTLLRNFCSSSSN